MAASDRPEEGSTRKRISLPHVDESSITWWEMQHDPSLSLRMLIRAEIERNGFTDVAYRPVVQQARRGRPPGSTSDSFEVVDDTTQETPALEAPVASPVIPEAQTIPAPTISRESELVGAGSMSPIDAIMNG